MPDPTPFEQALAEAASAWPAGPSGPPEDAVGEALQAHRERLAGARTLGDPSAPDDLYAVADALAASMRSCYPGIRCREGCSGCCETPTAVFDVTAREWDVIAHHLETTWTPERRASMLDRFRATHRPRRLAYRLLALIGHFEPVADRYFARTGYVCPFLEGGSCGIYPVRPLVCRMYGHHATGGSWRRRAAVYGCRLQAGHFEAYLAAGRLRLPSAEAMWARARRLTREAPWRWWRRARILPLWLAAWAPEGYDAGVPPAPPPSP